jgi:DNA uptake protein ComE-like DNA-binding protein
MTKEEAQRPARGSRKGASRAAGEAPRIDGEIEERIRRAAASAARAAEQRAADEILALEEDLERAKKDATEKVAQLERRLADMEARATEAEREARLMRDVELRLRAIEGQLREVTDSGREETKRARPGDDRTTPADLDQIEAIDPQDEPQPTVVGALPASLETASYEELRAFGLTVTQAKRVLAYRGRLEGFESFNDLHRLPGFPRPLLAQIEEKLTR